MVYDRNVCDMCFVTLENMSTTRVASDGTQSRAWIFTLFYGGFALGPGGEPDPSRPQPSYDDAIVCLSSFRDNGATYYVVGEEECPTTGNLHLQGYVQFGAKKRLSQIKGWPGMRTAHLGLASGTEVHNKEYCSKTRAQDEVPNEVVHEWGTPYIVDGGDSNKKRWENARDAVINAARWDDVIAAVPADIYVQHRSTLKRIFLEDRPNLPKRQVTELRPWQESLRQRLLQPPDDRTIIWVYDEVGGKGKSRMTDYLVTNMNAQDLSILPDFTRYAQAIDTSKTLFVLDYPRNHSMNMNYAIMEKIKDQSIRSSMYEGQMKYLDASHVVVFANVLPDTTQFSADRLEIITL